MTKPIYLWINLPLDQAECLQAHQIPLPMQQIQLTNHLNVRQTLITVPLPVLVAPNSTQQGLLVMMGDPPPQVTVLIDESNGRTSYCVCAFMFSSSSTTFFCRIISMFSCKPIWTPTRNNTKFNSLYYFGIIFYWKLNWTTTKLSEIILNLHSSFLIVFNSLEFDPKINKVWLLWIALFRILSIMLFCIEL